LIAAAGAGANRTAAARKDEAAKAERMGFSGLLFRCRERAKL